MEFNYREVVTHSTIFHADDVFGMALCRMLKPGIPYRRTVDQDEIEEAMADPEVLVFDIGLGKYDHHQVDKALREDGTPYCGFGLLWRDFGHILCPEEAAWKKVDETLVLPIDKHDNGVSQNLLSSMIGQFNPNWNEEGKPEILEEHAFSLAMHIAKAMLKAAIDRANAAVEAVDAVLDCYLASPTEEILVLDEYLPYGEAVHNEEKLKNVLFAVYPGKRGGWNVQTITKQPGTYINRMDFPSSWLGHADPERGIRFAHTANFLIACDTKEQAIRCAEEAIEAGSVPAVVVASI